ncbi:051R [Invertebrate iridescent virus 6]|uniref:051R n=1 Tax=Invertebrate iridescent virus 6 TaxID=176652 RepID=Q91G48_IIV6|nr:051R [Invertebrate iridescent virus 6]AAK81984.1 051R [Invertebrate iridescent virus 6]
MFPYQFQLCLKIHYIPHINLYNLVIECCIVHIYVYLKDLYSKDYVLDLNYLLIHLYLNVLR